MGHVVLLLAAFSLFLSLLRSKVETVIVIDAPLQLIFNVKVHGTNSD